MRSREVDAVARKLEGRAPPAAATAAAVLGGQRVEPAGSPGTAHEAGPTA